MGRRYMIQTKLSTLINSVSIMQQLANSQLNGRTAYTVGKLIKQIENEINLFYETREKVVNRYGMKDENNELIIDEQQYKIDPDHLEEFNAEILNLLDTDIVFNINPIKIEELENLELTPAQMLLIDDFITE